MRQEENKENVNASPLGRDLVLERVIHVHDLT